MFVVTADAYGVQLEVPAGPAADMVIERLLHSLCPDTLLLKLSTQMILALSSFPYRILFSARRGSPISHLTRSFNHTYRPIPHPRQLLCPSHLS